jgi:tetratricopeptide (TPR) repeat protein
MAIESSISELGLIDLFQLLSLQRKTGRLIISDGPGGKEAQVLFAEGAVGFASIYQRVPRTAVALLLEWGVIEKDALRRIEKTLHDYDNLADCLDGEGVVSRDFLNSIVSSRTQDVVYELFKWHQGFCRYTEMGTYDEKLNVIVPLNTENLIMEGARRIDEWENITSKVPSPYSIFRICAADENDGQKLNLNPKEWEILSLIDGRCSVKEAAEAVSCDLFTTSKLIYGLVVMNVIELVEHQPEAAAGAERAAPELGTLLDRGRQFMETGELERAVSEYEKAIQIDPGSFEAMRKLGEIYYKLNKLGEASVYLKKARIVNPEHEKTIFISGQLHARLGEVALAVKEWNQLRKMTSNRKIAEIMQHNIDTARKWVLVLQRY